LQTQIVAMIQSKETLNPKSKLMFTTVMFTWFTKTKKLTQDSSSGTLSKKLDFRNIPQTT